MADKEYGMDKPLVGSIASSKPKTLRRRTRSGFAAGGEVERQAFVEDPCLPVHAAHALMQYSNYRLQHTLTTASCRLTIEAVSCPKQVPSRFKCDNPYLSLFAIQLAPWARWK